MLRVFRDVCEAVQYLHTYKTRGAARTLYETNQAMSTEDERSQDREALLRNQQDQPTGEQIQMGERGEIIPWAHRDIKPGNVLLTDDGETPILMDFGSACPARIPINTRQEALKEQDLAAEHCTMPYRAPELFDVKVGTTLDEKVDVWSLGCTLYAMAFGQSPFEVSLDGGGSVALAVLNNQYKFPEGSPYSPKVNDIINWMLTTNPANRPSVKEVIVKLDELLSTGSN